MIDMICMIFWKDSEGVFGKELLFVNQKSCKIM